MVSDGWKVAESHGQWLKDATSGDAIFGSRLRMWKEVRRSISRIDLSGTCLETQGSEPMMSV